eukprot:5173553-Pyramimonas_sp.AAC.1
MHVLSLPVAVFSCSSMALDDASCACICTLDMSSTYSPIPKSSTCSTTPIPPPSFSTLSHCSHGCHVYVAVDPVRVHD